ncbi:MAG: hypothetical protein IJ929_04305 [Prevotella sp.]|nr:hypothetical protein [Prevotella sp.]
MKKVLTVVVFLLMSIGAWAGEVIIKPSNGGSVVPSSAGAGETCTLTVTPDDGYYLKSLTAVTTVDGSAIQAPARRVGTGSIEMDETELTITSDSNADPSGETTHTFTMPSDGNFNVEVTAEFEARINISDAVITLAATSFTYDGTEKEPAVSSVVVGGTPLNANEFSVSYSNNIIVSDAATVTLTGQRKYTGTATETFTILAKSITSDMITLTPSSFVFSGNPQTPVVTILDNINNEDYQLESTDYDLTYQLVNTGENPVTVEEAEVVDVATYNVVVTGKGNYTGSVSKSFEITKAPLSLTVSLDGWTYGEQPEEIEATVEGNEEEGDMTFYYKVRDADDNTYTSVVPENAGIYTIKVEVAETANYAAGSATADFTIGKAYLTVEGVRELTVSITGWKYGEEPKAPSVDGNLGNGTVTYTYKDAEDDEAEFSEDVPTNVGSYIVKATVAESANYFGGEAYNEFSIEKGDLTMVSASVPEELVYDDTDHQLITVSNVPEGATAKYYWSEISEGEYEASGYMLCDPGENLFSTTVPTSKNAGYYAIIYMVNGGDNYNDILASQTIKVAIYPAEITEMTLSATSLPYNGSDQTVTITSVKAGTMTANDYTVTLNGQAVEGDIEAKEVGEYTVEVTGTGNFTGTESATFSIVNRTLADNEVEFHENWATYYSADGDVELPAGIGAYVATGVGDGVVTVSQISYIPEKVAVLLNNETTTTTENTNVASNMLQHAAAEIAVSNIDGIVYGLYNGKMMRVTGTISKDKNYLLVPNEVVGGGNASQLTIVIDNEDNFTSVNDVKIKMNEVDGNIYDLTGRKLQNLSKKGLYIQNGRKVVVK